MTPTSETSLATPSITPSITPPIILSVTDQPVAETKSVATVLTERPLVSVIIPTYDRLDYLREAIASAVSQTYTNLEIIVADDCGPANSKEVVDSFQDSRIQYKRNPTNLGVSLNLARSFAAAKGKYVASLNDDDRWDQHFFRDAHSPFRRQFRTGAGFFVTTSLLMTTVISMRLQPKNKPSEKGVLSSAKESISRLEKLA